MCEQIPPCVRCGPQVQVVGACRFSWLLLVRLVPALCTGRKPHVLLGWSHHWANSCKTFYIYVCKIKLYSF